MPCRLCPKLDLYIEWIYLIDLDQNVFRVYGRDDPYTWDCCGIQYFRLDNIPRWLFELQPIELDPNVERIYSVYPVITASPEILPGEHWANYLREIPTPDPELLELYQSLSLRLGGWVPVAAHIPVWRRLQVQLLEQFVEYFLRSFHDVCPSRKSSPFIIRQLAFATLCILRSGPMKFHSTSSPRKLRLGTVRGGIQTPAWEPPDADSYWLDNVLVLLNEHIHDKKSQPSPTIQAAIAKAVQLASAADSSSDVTAIIFSIYCIVIVNIKHMPHGPEVSHSFNIPLFSFCDVDDAFGSEDMRILRATQFLTFGVQILLDVFSAHPVLPRSPSGRSSHALPTELCQQIFRCADPTVQTGLEASCRLFREIAMEYPRIGEWTLLKCSGKREFIALRSSTNTEHVVQLKPIRAPPRGANTTAFELSLEGCGERLYLNMPPFVVSVVQ